MKPYLPPNPTLADVSKAWEELDDRSFKVLLQRRIGTTSTAIAHGLKSVPVGWFPLNAGADRPEYTGPATEKFIYALAPTAGLYDIVVVY